MEPETPETDRPEASTPARALTILLVEDSEDDILIARRALRVVGGPERDLRVVRDGEQALAYLRREDEFAAPGAAPSPDLVLLDVNMPRLDGFGVLAARQEDETLRVIPVVVLTTSSADWDVRRAYELGANSYVVKPESYRRTVDVMRSLCDYWSFLGRRVGVREATLGMREPTN